MVAQPRSGEARKCAAQSAYQGAVVGHHPERAKIAPRQVQPDAHRMMNCREVVSTARSTVMPVQGRRRSRRGADTERRGAASVLRWRSRSRLPLPRRPLVLAVRSLTFLHTGARTVAQDPPPHWTEQLCLPATRPMSYLPHNAIGGWHTLIEPHSHQARFISTCLDCCIVVKNRNTTFGPSFLEGLTNGRIRNRAAGAAL